MTAPHPDQQAPPPYPYQQGQPMYPQGPPPPPEMPVGTMPPPPPYGMGAYGPPQGYVDQGPPPSSYKALAIVAVVVSVISMLTWALTIPAVVFAFKVDSRWMMGDAAGAMKASKLARNLAIIGIVVAVILNIAVFLIFSALGHATSSGPPTL